MDIVKVAFIYFCYLILCICGVGCLSPLGTRNFNKFINTFWFASLISCVYTSDPKWRQSFLLIHDKKCLAHIYAKHESIFIVYQKSWKNENINEIYSQYHVVWLLKKDG